MISFKSGAAVTAPVTVSLDGKTPTPTTKKEKKEKKEKKSQLGKKSQYEAKISGAKDLAGNAVADKNWSFITSKK